MQAPKCRTCGKPHWGAVCGPAKSGVSRETLRVRDANRKATQQVDAMTMRDVLANVLRRAG